MRSVLMFYERGQCLDALREAEKSAPISSWQGVEACGLAARIAANTGAPRLAARLASRAWRADKLDPAAQLQYGFELSSRRGPLALWLAMRKWPEPRKGSSIEEAELLALRGTTAALLRDFGQAEDLLSRAERLETRHPWVHLQRAHLLERQDHVEEALEAARAACRLHKHPFYRPGIQVCAHLLQLLDKDQEAIQLLSDASAALQNAPVAVQLYAILTDSGLWQEAEAALERYAALCPLMEPALKTWLASQRSRVAYHLGRREEARKLASTLDDEFHKGFAARLSSEPVVPERVQLEVSFVRQHFKTCAPATLAALGRFWKMPSDHLKMAESMCYDGTPHWAQRDWAENNGWCVREFRVTYESAVSLLAVGAPFAISTVEATSAHMQAVVGFDRTRGTLFLRDPGQPYLLEAPAAEFFEHYRSFGPHGMVFIPSEQKGKIQGLALPDEELCDLHHQMWMALSRHQREPAARAVAEITSRHPDHELAWEARLELATYDANNSEQARCLDKLLELFPKCPARQLRRLTCLRDASREERILFLKEVCAKKDADPALFIELARVLSADARSLQAAYGWLKRAFVLRPMDSNAIMLRADLRWQEGDLEEATELYRFAANLEGFREGLYQSWFMACRATRRTQEALAHLQDRFARFGEKSEQPALTLAWAWRELDHPEKAREVLVEAGRRRPNDGTLLLRSASLLAGLHQEVEAERLLNEARDKVRENDWLRAAVERSELRLDANSVLQFGRALLQLEPLALDAHATVARALAHLEGNNAAQDHLRNACAAYPHNCALQRLYVEWSRYSGPAAVESAAREFLKTNPSDAWARRELAMALCSLNRKEEALQEAIEGTEIEPWNSFSFSVLGYVRNELQQFSQSRDDLRRAITLSVDNTYALRSLVDFARTDAQRREELKFIEDQLIKQVVSGDGLLTFLEVARPLLPPEKLLNSLRQVHTQRPDLWHGWSALISQLGFTGALNEARDLACEAVEKFPHLPRLWLDLATVYQWRNESEDEIRAAEHAFEMNPAWTEAALAFAGALERLGRMDKAARVYERALTHSPRDPQLHACHAYLLWRQRKPEPAFEAVYQALRLAPDFEWAWGLLNDWAESSGQPSKPAEFARTISSEKPGDARVWLMLARILDDPLSMTERLNAVAKALELDANFTEAWDLKAELLANAEKFDEAIAVCEEGVLVCTAEVHRLHGRRAWIEARRRQFAEAVRLMQKLLDENVNYAWGWNQLAAWLMQLNANEEATTALEQLIRLRPREAWVYRQLGFLKLQMGDKTAAQQAFEKAVEFAPTDVSAAQNMFDLQLKAGDLNGAAATLRLMEVHQPGAATLASEVQLHLNARERRKSNEAFEKLCAEPDPNPWPVESAAEAYRKAGRSRCAEKILRKALKGRTCNPEVGAALIHLLIASRKDYAAVWDFLMMKPGEIQRRAAGPLVKGLAELKSRMLFRLVLWLRRAVFLQDDAAWGQVGYALSSFNRMGAVASWLSDWRNRTDVQPWVFFNFCLALRHMGRYEESNSLAKHVLETLGHREGSADMRLFLAVEDALAGDIAKASQHLEKVVVRQDVAHDGQLLALAKSLVEFQQLSPADKTTGFKRLRSTLNEQFSSWVMANAMRDIRRTFKRAGKVFVQNGAGWRARLWVNWKLYWHWTLLALLPLALFPPVAFGLFIWMLVRNRN